MISDTHDYLDPAVFMHFANCDEIWHAGDFGSIGIANELKQKLQKPLKGVFGNIDGYGVRSEFPETLTWHCEEVSVFMKHIGGYPKKYAPGVKKELVKNQSNLFISGHSHILKVIFDSDINCLHINPGAAGKQGWHKVRTVVRLTIDGAGMKDCEVIELGSR